MEIIIEIGTDEQKALIRQELDLLGEIVKNFDPPLNLTRIVIPENFDKKVNEIEGNPAYSSKRGIENNQVATLAKISKDGEGYAIIVTPFLYTQIFDDQIRYFIFLHELIHVVNRRDFPLFDEVSLSKKLYMEYLRVLFDEYYADRRAYQLGNIIFPNKTELWENHIEVEIRSYLSSLVNQDYYNALVSEIKSFRHSGDISVFLSASHLYIDVVSQLISHTFARFHEFPEKVSEAELLKSKFINQKTINLMNYFSETYENGSLDFSDGLKLVEEFMTNFGVRYEDRGDTLYCNVLDI